MTKFSELCISYKASRERFVAYRESCWRFSSAMMTAYKSYLAIPEEKFNFVPLDETPDPASKYPLMGAMHLHEDGYWHVGLRLSVHPQNFPRQDLLIRFRIKGVDAGFRVSVAEGHDGFLIDGTSEGAFVPLFDYLQALMRGWFESGLQRFLDQSSPLKTIGFIQNAL